MATTTTTTAGGAGGRDAAAAAAFAAEAALPHKSRKRSKGHDNGDDGEAAKLRRHPSLQQQQQQQRPPPPPKLAPRPRPMPLAPPASAAPRGAHVDMSQLVRVMALSADAGDAAAEALFSMAAVVASASGTTTGAGGAVAAAGAAAATAPCGGGGGGGGCAVAGCAWCTTTSYCALAQRAPALLPQHQPPHGHYWHAHAAAVAGCSGQALSAAASAAATVTAAPAGAAAAHAAAAPAPALQALPGVTSARRTAGDQAGDGDGDADDPEGGGGGNTGGGGGGGGGPPRGAPGRFIYGNYHKYYGYRLGDGAAAAATADPRVRALDPAWLRGRRLLDVGCNEGVVTLAVAAEFGCSRADGVDIDPVLISKARGNAARMRGALRDHLRALAARPGKPSGYDPAMRAVSRRLKALSRVAFTAANWLDAPAPAGRYDVATVLSVTKWVHLNWGDEGLVKLFHKLHRVLAPGGVLVLEPQPWRSYHAAARKRATCAVPFRRCNELLKMRPDGFAGYLTSVVGFELIAELSVGGSGGGGGGGGGSGGRAAGAAEAAAAAAAADDNGGSGDEDGSGSEGADDEEEPEAAGAAAADAADGRDKSKGQDDDGGHDDDDLASLYSSLGSGPAPQPSGSAARRAGKQRGSGASGGQSRGRQQQPPQQQPAKPNGFSVRPLLIFRKPL